MNLLRRFDSKYKILESGCWQWFGATSGMYGQLKVKGKSDSAHRISWILHFGNIPEHLNVCHSCGNKLCVNPEHLFLSGKPNNKKEEIEEFIYA